jgi:carbon-monoxide dehydrogenase large subunit
MGEKLFGAAVKRTEDPALLTGRGRFVDDIHLAGMLHAAFVRSSYAHARGLCVDTSAAAAMAGVHAVLTYRDLPQSVRQKTLAVSVPNPAIKQLVLPYALVKDEACYVGEPIAIVVAESRHLAEDAAGAVGVEYEPLPAAVYCRDAAEPDAPRAHSHLPSNIAAPVQVNVGDVARAFKGAPHVFRERIEVHRGGAFFIECRGIVVAPDPILGGFTAFCTTQTPHRLKRQIVELFDLREDQVRVVVPEIGGGFGPKGPVYSDYIATAAAAQLLARPVKWIEDRREDFLATSQQRDQWWDIEIAVNAAARILGLRGRMYHDSGAYMTGGLTVPWISATTVPGPYVVPNYHLDYYAVLTNKVPVTSVRGSGRPEAVVVMERMIERVARELKLDPAEVRRRNYIKPEQMPYNVGILFRDNRPVVYDSGDYPAALEKLLGAADYAGFRARQQAVRRAGRYLGIGISNAVEATGLGPYESATVSIAPSGKITVYTGASPQGQGHKTTLAQIAADQLGVGLDGIVVVAGDTATVAQGMGSFAARTAVNAGNSVHLAAHSVADKAKKLAAAMFEVAEDDLELEGGLVRVKGVPGMAKPLGELATRTLGVPGFAMDKSLDPGLDSTAYFKPDQSVYASSAHAAEVEVDIETGAVKILNFTVVHDCGRAINPLVVEGQVIGGVAHGIGNALFERLLYDAEGQPLTTTFGDYLLPIARDVPKVAIVHHECPTPLNPLGVKGAGEGGTIAAIAAIANAIENALEPFGVTIRETPVTPERIVELLGETALGRTR